MSRAFQNTRGAGFAYAMLYPGLQRVVQAAGRLNQEDRDVLPTSRVVELLDILAEVDPGVAADAARLLTLGVLPRV